MDITLFTLHITVYALQVLREAEELLSAKMVGGFGRRRTEWIASIARHKSSGNMTSSLDEHPQPTADVLPYLKPGERAYRTVSSDMCSELVFSASVGVWTVDDTNRALLLAPRQ